MADAQAIETAHKYVSTGQEENNLKLSLKKARKAFAVQSRFGFGNSEKAKNAEVEYKNALKQYSEYLFINRSAAAAKRVMDWEGTKVFSAKYAKIAAVTAGVAFFLATGVDLSMIPTLAAKSAATAFEWTSLNATNVAASALVGFGVRWFFRKGWDGQFKYKNAAQLATAQKAEAAWRKSGKSFAEFIQTEEGKTVARQVRSERWGKVVASGIGMVLGFGTYEALHHGIGQEVSERLGIDHGLARVYDFVAKFFDPGTKVFEAASLKASLAHNVTDIGTIAGSMIGVADAHPMPTTNIHGIPADQVKHAHLGANPFDGKHPETITLDEAREAARRLGWGAQQEAGFVKAIEEGKIKEITVGYDEITKQNYIVNPDGSRSYIAMDKMITGSKTLGPVTVDGGTKVYEIRYDYTDAQGKVHHMVAYSPLICENIADGGEVIPPEAYTTPAPAEPACAPWSFDTYDITLDGHQTKVLVARAASGMTLEQATGELAQKILDGSIHPPKGAVFELYIDADCDGHYEKIECVKLITNPDGTATLEVDPLGVDKNSELLVRHGADRLEYYDDKPIEWQKEYLKFKERFKVARQ